MKKLLQLKSKIFMNKNYININHHNYNCNSNYNNNNNHFLNPNYYSINAINKIIKI